MISVSCLFPECSRPHRRYVQRETSVGVRTELLTKQHCTRTGRWYEDECQFICNTHTVCITAVPHSPLSVVQINNAGCMVNQRELTEEGLEKNFATNTLGKTFFRGGNHRPQDMFYQLRCNTRVWEQIPKQYFLEYLEKCKHVFLQKSLFFFW